MAKILIIEDDTLVSRMYQKTLDFEGFKVEVAGDGREGLAKAKTGKPDLILCDIMMPNVNGIEVLVRLKADEELKSIPVVMLTNLAGTEDAKTAMDKGALTYLVKSEYRPKEIADKVSQILNKKEPATEASKKETVVKEK